MFKMVTWLLRYPLYMNYSENYHALTELKPCSPSVSAKKNPRVNRNATNCTNPNCFIKPMIFKGFGLSNRWVLWWIANSKPRLINVWYLISTNNYLKNESLSKSSLHALHMAVKWALLMLRFWLVHFMEIIPILVTIIGSTPLVICIIFFAVCILN